MKKKVTKEVLKNPNLYIVITKEGEKLNKLTKDGIQYAMSAKGYATLEKANLDKVEKVTSVTNGVANVMNVASMVVGQYYMSEINNKLENMHKSIDKISDFQEREFKSRILSLIDRTSKISQFSAEILENDNLRNRNLQTLSDLEGECSELLKQVNITINDIVNKNSNPKYPEYQKASEEIYTLLQYQMALLQTSEEISKLTYLINKGEIKMEMSHCLFKKQFQESMAVRNSLQQWHDTQVENLKIDLENNRVSKYGIEGFLSHIPAVFDEKWNYKELAEGFAEKISIKKEIEKPTLSDDIYEQDVRLIVKDGKYFYLKD